MSHITLWENRWQDHGPLLNQKDIQRFELERAITFPKDYSNFLLQINGGMPMNSLFSPNGQGQLIQWIHPLYSFESMYYESVDSANPIGLDNFLPDRFLEVGTFINGDVIALSCSEAQGDFGQVFLQDQDLDPEPDPWTTLTKLCSDFSVFIKSLEAWE